MVEGDKIVDETPTLETGESFSYNSYHLTHSNVAASGCFSSNRSEHDYSKDLMKITDLNKAHDIGSNSLLVEIGPFSFFVDAGLHPKKAGLEAMPDFSLVNENSLDYIILTHAHLDHLGALPVLARKQPQAQILSSLPTINLAPRMLINSHSIMMLQREQLNLKEYPLYTRSEIQTVSESFLTMSFGNSRIFEKDGQQIEVTFYPAGHVAGAAGVLFNYRHRKIFFTGDVLFQDQQILPGAKFPKGPFDTLVMETTRGATPTSTTKKTRESEVERLIESINNTIQHDGSCLIPVFALGRMQEILAIFHEYRSKGKLLNCPIFCSGLGMSIIEHFDTISKKTNLIHFRKKLVTTLNVKPIKKASSHGDDPSPKGIYLVSSGMLVEKTPSYLLASAMVEHSHNSIFFVGYCDPDTPGGKLLATEHGNHFSFKDLDYITPIRATIDKFELSGHANREELLKFALKADPRAIVLTHGAPDARLWFEAELYKHLPEAKILDPTPGFKHEV